MAQPAALSIEKVDSLMQVSAKPVLIMLTTDWCKYCQLQKNQLRKNKEFQANTGNCYYVEFDAERKAPVTFHGHTYNYKATGVSTGIHELAIQLSGEKGAGYPAWILLNKDYQVLFRYNGVMSPEQLKILLQAM
jgi:thioredoxin-related protein